MTTDVTKNARARPLCVDLDGTLLRTDLLHESVLRLLAKNFLYVLRFPLWLIKGKAYFKQQVADRVDLSISAIPYEAELLDYLNAEREKGRSLVIVSAANRKYAEAVAEHFGIFDDVLASDAKINLAGRAKLDALVARYGERGFDYAANAHVDLEIWAHAEGAIIVNPDPGVLRAARDVARIEKLLQAPPGAAMAHLRALRPHQWQKNVLLFVPLVLSHQLGDPELTYRAVLGFIAFCLCASSVYLLNDLLDLNADRRHPTKRRRPIASGAVPIKHALLMFPVLLALSWSVAQELPREFAMALGLYFAVTLAYSYRLKKAAIVDVLTLAGLYTMRIIAGAIAISVVISFWLLAFSTFLFLSLALVKRYTELLTLKEEGQVTATGRGYYPQDIETLAHLGTSAGYMSVLVLALYINSEAVLGQYRTPQMIWLHCPLLLYLISRIWLLARRNHLHEDPVVFVTRDRHSQLVALIAVALLWAAI